MKGTAILSFSLVLFIFNICKSQNYTPKITDEQLNTSGFNTSGACNVNVNCPEGKNYQVIKRSVVRIFDTTRYYRALGTGVILNNAKNDFKPYVLTAYHVIADIEEKYFDRITFYFNYETSDCENIDNETYIKSQTITGFKLLAYSPQDILDFALLELNQNIPISYNAYYSGWDKDDSDPPLGICIHHPSSDVKKISISDNIKGNGNNWVVYFKQTKSGFGITEPGSSGSPLFNNNGSVIGTLKGGRSSCLNTSLSDYFGRFSHNMDLSATLKEYLDPDNSGITILNGTENNFSNLKNNISFSKTEIFPNPCKNELNIRFYECPERILISNINGSPIKFFKLNEKKSITFTVNTSEFQNGIYFLTIEYQSFEENKIFFVNK